jgi:hypothetical protein
VVTLAASFAASASSLLSSSMERLSGIPMNSLPALEEGAASAGSARASVASPFTDPIMIALVCAGLLFFISWRMGGKKSD